MWPEHHPLCYEWHDGTVVCKDFEDPKVSRERDEEDKA